MLKDKNSVEVGAYYYPLTPYCPVRRWRARLISADIELPLPAYDINELRLARNAHPLFADHEQPRTYCLPDGDELVTDWDDTCTDALTTQAILAASHGLSYLIFATYNGLRDGAPNPELNEANRIASRSLRTLGRHGLKYARMEALEGPRALLPIPDKKALLRGLGGAFIEPGREYDVTPEAAQFIVDRNVKEWKTPQYLKAFGWRPYLGLMTPSLSRQSDKQKSETLCTFIEAIQDYSSKKYDVVPYLVGVMRQESDIDLWLQTGVDALTQYCALPNHALDAPAIQDYQEQFDMNKAAWPKLQHLAISAFKSFVPSISIGWDASPRGGQEHSFGSVNQHPYRPIITGGHALTFAKALREGIHFAAANTPEDERFLTIFAWNEVSEGATFLPRLQTNGTVDISYLRTLSQVVHESAICHFCQIFPNHRERLQQTPLYK